MREGLLHLFQQGSLSIRSFGPTGKMGENKRTHRRSCCKLANVLRSEVVRGEMFHHLLLNGLGHIRRDAGDTGHGGIKVDHLADQQIGPHCLGGYTGAPNGGRAEGRGDRGAGGEGGAGMKICEQLDP